MGFIPENSKFYCYTYLTPHLFERAGANLGNPDPKYFAKAFSFCDKILGQENLSVAISCYAGFGKEFVVLANDRNVENIQSMSNDKLKKVYNWCLLSPNKIGVEPCINSALQSLFWGGENDRHIAINFCSVITDEKYRSDCYTSLTGAVGHYINDQNYKKDYCQELPKSFQENCKQHLLST